MLGIGKEIKGIPIAVVNDENMNDICADFSVNGSAIPYGYIKCRFNHLSCRFLSYLDDPMLETVRFMKFYFSTVSLFFSGVHG